MIAGHIFSITIIFAGIRLRLKKKTAGFAPFKMMKI